VRNLEEAGVIVGYRPAVDPAAGDRGFQMLVDVTMEIKNCRRMFGDPDYVLCVGVADLAAYAFQAVISNSAAQMKFVDLAEVVDRETVGILAGCPERIGDARA